MKLPYALAAAAGVMFTLALPALAADMDPAKMTCKDFAAMDADGMMKATTAIKEAAKTDKMADPKKLEMSDEDVTKMVMTSCEGKPDMMMMDTMHSDQ